MTQDIDTDELAGILSRIDDSPLRLRFLSDHHPGRARGPEMGAPEAPDDRVHLCQIARDPGISLCRITRGARGLTRTGSATRHILNHYHDAQAPERPAR